MLIVLYNLFSALMFNYFGKDYFHYEQFINDRPTKNFDFSECSFIILSKVHMLYDKVKIIKLGCFEDYSTTLH